MNAELQLEYLQARAMLPGLHINRSPLLSDIRLLAGIEPCQDEADYSRRLGLLCKAASANLDTDTMLQLLKGAPRHIFSNGGRGLKRIRTGRFNAAIICADPPFPLNPGRSINDEHIFFGLPLICAVRCNNLEAVKSFLADGAYDSSQWDHGTPDRGLVIAAKRGYHDIVQQLLDSYTNLSDTAHGKHIERETGSDFLFHPRSQQHSLSFKVRQRNVEYAVRGAAHGGYWDIVLLLLDAGFIESGQRYELTLEALVIASRQGHDEVVQRALDCGVSPDSRP